MLFTDDHELSMARASTTIPLPGASYDPDNGTRKSYRLRKFARSNQGNCVNQRPIVDEG
ncbi:hypothetical protein ACIBG0_01620 [Nocardia sp. NPDC050630]|uniref:hypothetical protein n=1 Tax=Nocardia sp. NPDC050630 TaxID=3364321 RepID=UPI003793CCD4